MWKTCPCHDTPSCVTRTVTIHGDYNESTHVWYKYITLISEPISTPAHHLIATEFITLGPHEAGVWAKHPRLTIPAPSRADTLAPAISRGCPSCLHWLLTWVACGAHPCRSCVVAPRDYFQDDKGASGILLSTLTSVASDLFNYALRLDNELSARPPRGRHGLWTGLKTQMVCLQIVWWNQ